MLKKIAVAVLSAVLLVVSVALPVSAASVTADTGNQVYVGYPLDVVQGNKNADGSYWINYYSGRTSGVLGIMFPVNLLISRGDIVKWGAFYTSFYFSISSTTTESVTLGLMDEYYGFTPLETESYSTAKKGSFGEQFEGGERQFDFDFDVRYICVKLNGEYGQNSAGTFGWQPYTFKVSSMDENSIMLEGVREEQQETNNKLDELLQQPEQEKQEAGGSGNSAVDGLTSAIPSDNDGVIAAMRNLASAMSYTGTECTWTFPALYLPKIDGVMERMQLTEEKPIDFAEWIQAMPPDVLEIVRIVGTIALILFCFKELYSMIRYILTMKGGGSGE